MSGFLHRIFEKRDVQFSPNLSVMLAELSRSAGPLNVSTESALRQMAVRACIRVLAEDIASLPLIVYRRLEAGGKERATEYPLYPVLHQSPNPEMTSFQFRETMMLHVLTHGNAFAEIVFTNGRPTALWPISPTRVSARRLTRDSGVLEYLVQPEEGGPVVVMPASRMFHLRGLSNNGVWGRSPIADARDAIGLGMSAEQFAAGFFVRGMKPSIVLQHPDTLSQDAYTRLRDSIAEQHEGLSNAQRSMILEEGMTAKEITTNPEDAQFIEQRQFSVLEIARLYRVAPHKIGVTEGSQAYASVEEANRAHVTDAIRPWAVRWEQQMNTSLIPADDEGFFAEMLFDSLLRGDTKTRFESYSIARQNGIMSTNDIRELENMNAIEGGDVYWRPANMTDADAPIEPPQPPTAPPARSNGHKQEANYVLV